MKFLVTIEIDAKEHSSPDDVLVWAGVVLRDHPSARVVSARPKPEPPSFPAISPSPLERDKKGRPG